MEEVSRPSTAYLPIEIQLIIIKKLNYYDLIRSRLVNSTWNGLCLGQLPATDKCSVRLRTSRHNNVENFMDVFNTSKRMYKTIPFTKADLMFGKGCTNPNSIVEFFKAYAHAFKHLAVHMDYAGYESMTGSCSLNTTEKHNIQALFQLIPKYAPNCYALYVDFPWGNFPLDFDSLSLQGNMNNLKELRMSCGDLGQVCRMVSHFRGVSSSLCRVRLNHVGFRDIHTWNSMLETFAEHFPSITFFLMFTLANRGLGGIVTSISQPTPKIRLERLRYFNEKPFSRQQVTGFKSLCQSIHTQFLTKVFLRVKPQFMVEIGFSSVILPVLKVMDLIIEITDPRHPLEIISARTDFFKGSLLPTMEHIQIHYDTHRDAPRVADNYKELPTDFFGLLGRGIENEVFSSVKSFHFKLCRDLRLPDFLKDNYQNLFPRTRANVGM